jgi:hypothetical protein
MLRDVCYSAAVGGQADIRRTGDFNVAGAEVIRPAAGALGASRRRAP